MLTIDEWLDIVARNPEKDCSGFGCTRCPFGFRGNRECYDYHQEYHRHVPSSHSSSILYEKYNIKKKIEELL